MWNKDEKEAQFAFTMPELVRKQIAIRAMQEDLTMRGFLSKAVRDQGISVPNDAIVDKRRK